MQLQYFLLPANGQAFTLGDDTAPTVIHSNFFQWGAPGYIKEGFEPSQDSQVDIVPLVRSAYAAVVARFNFVERVKFTVQRQFATYEMEDSFATYHGHNVPVSGELMKVEISPTGISRSYLKNAVLSGRPKCIRHTGVSVDFTYEFAAPNAWQNTP